MGVAIAAATAAAAVRLRWGKAGREMQVADGHPLQMEEQGGGTQEIAFVRATASCLRPRLGARQAQGRPHHKKPPSGQRAPPLRYQARFTGSQESRPWTWTLPLPPRGPRDFPWTTLPSRSLTSTEAECPGENYEPGSCEGSPPG